MTMRPSVKNPRFWVLQAALAAAWIALWYWGLVLTQTPSASLWFPPAGLSFAMFLTEGPWAAIPVLVGGVVTTFQSASIYHDPRGWDLLLASGIAFGLAHSFAYWLGATLFDRFHGDAKLGTPRSVFGFLLFSTMSAAFAAFGGIGSLRLTLATGVTLRADSIPWAIGDLVAVVTLAPVFVVVCDRALGRLGLETSGWIDGLHRLGSPSSSRTQFVLKILGSVGLAFALAALGTVPGLFVPVALVVYALIVPLTWIAHTEGAIRAVAAVACLAAAMASAAAIFGTTEQAFNLQAAMIAIAGTSLFNLTVPRLYADNRRLRDLVTFDQLTGAFARPVFLEIAERELQRAQRSGAAMALIAVDIDHFKEVNDSFGHGIGDRVLARVGAICRATLRGGEIFGRIGGEEFAVLLPATDPDAARFVAERLRLAIERAAWAEFAGVGEVTASFGVAGVGLADDSLASAMERADQAMYEAKRAGRNCVRVA